MQVPRYAANQVGSVAMPPINPMGSAADYSLEHVFNFEKDGKAIDGWIEGFQKEQLRRDTDYARDTLNSSQNTIGKFLIDAQQRSPKENMNLDQEFDGILKNQYDQGIKNLSGKAKDIYSAGFDAQANDYKLKVYQLKTNATEQFSLSTVNGQNDNLKRDLYAGNINLPTFKMDFEPNLNYLARNMSPEEAKAFKQDKYSQVYIGYADKIASTDPNGAKAYLEQNKAGMNPMLLEGATVALNRQIKETELQNSKTPPDMKLFYELENLPWQQKRDINLDDPKYNGLTGDHRISLIKEIKKLKEGDKNTIASNETNTQIRTGFKTLGYSSDDMNKPEVQTLYAQYKDQISSYFNNLPEDKRNNFVGRDEAIRYMNDIVVTVPGWFSDETVKRWQIPYLKDAAQKRKAENQAVPFLPEKLKGKDAEWNADKGVWNLYEGDKLYELDRDGKPLRYLGLKKKKIEIDKKTMSMSPAGGMSWQ